MKYLVCAAAMTLIAALSGYAANTRYYVDVYGGNDAADGRSPTTAWRSLSKVNATIFGPGDTILFKAGGVWSGALTPGGSGSAGLVNVIDTFGAGARPIINAGGVTAALALTNQQYWEIRNLELTNDDDFSSENTSANRYGIRVTASGGTMTHIHIKNCYVHDVDGNADGPQTMGGISFTASNNGRFHDALIEGNTLRKVDRCGISAAAGSSPYSTHVIVRNNSMHSTGGDGVLIYSCRAALVEYNFLDSASARATGANAGYWPWASDSTVFQYNEACRTVAPWGGGPGRDRNGFDCDWRCRYTVMQYNYSHDNGGGFMLVCSPGDGQNEYNYYSTIRYNISQNDRYTVFDMMGPGSRYTQIYNNVIYLGAGVPCPKVVTNDSWGGTAGETSFKNNIFYIMNNAVFDSNPNFSYDYNCFYGVTGPADPHAIHADPMFVAPGAGAMGIASVDGYKLQEGSPCIDAGTPISNNGGKDYWGTPLYHGAPDIGACEYVDDGTGLSVGTLAANPSSISSSTGGIIVFSITATSAAGSISLVAIDLSALGGGSAVAMNGSGTYTASYTVPAGLATGTKTITATVRDNLGNEKTRTVSVLIRSATGTTSIYSDAASLVTYTWASDGQTTPTTTINEVTTDAAEGSRSYDIAFGIAGYWAGAGMGFLPLDFSVQDSLILSYKGPGAGLTVRIGLSFADNTNTENNGYLLQNAVSWTRAAIPMSAFSAFAAQLPQTNGVNFIITGAETGSGHLFVDDIYLTGSVPTSIQSPYLAPIYTFADRFLVRGRTICFTAHEPGAITLYKPSGAVIAQVFVRQGETVSLNAPAAGVFFVRTGNAVGRVVIR